MKTMRNIIGILAALALISCSAPAAEPSPAVTAAAGASSVPAVETLSTATAVPSTPRRFLNISIASADQALMNGDFTLAREEYRAAYAASGAPLTRSAALWGLGRVEFESGNYPQTLVRLRELLYYYYDSQQAAGACYLMAETLMALQRHEEAASYYECYLGKKPGVIDTYAQERLGDARMASANPIAAVNAYQAALAASHIGESIPLQIKLAQATAAAGDAATAQAMYAGIAANTDNFYHLAQVDLLAGQLHLEQGETDLAYARFQHAVSNYPEAYDSYTALVLLVGAGVPVDEFQRGLVDFYAGQYGYALDAFDRFLAADPEHDGTVHYYRALTLRALGDSPAAVAEWDIFINGYAGHPLWLDAWEDKAYTQWLYLEQYDNAAQTLLNFVQIAPGSASAPYELLVAARIMERGGDLDDASATWTRIANEYPTSIHVPQALHLAGITYYRQRNWDAALYTFQRAIPLTTNAEETARAYFWLGKTEQAMGDADGAQAAFQQAALADPTLYYSERARDMIYGRAPLEPAPAYDLEVDLLAEQADAEAWIRLTFDLPADTALHQTGSLAEDSRLVRGTELWQLGLYNEARAEFEDLRLAVSLDPADSYRLANYLLDLGMYRVAINAARQVLTLAGMETNAQAAAAPAYFQHVRFGTYYLDLVLPAAAENGLDPLFLLAVIRQESLFEGFVRSAAGARGLMQIMPATGQTIVDDYGWPADYDAEDLYRPQVSIRLGAHHLMTNRLYFNGDLYAALAAYNAGIGSAIIWDPLSNDDFDLFAEVVRYEETRSYIRGIYENYVAYRSLYSTIP